MKRENTPTLRCPCDRQFGAVSYTFGCPPPGETRFEIVETEYSRYFWRCRLCRHEFAECAIDLASLYSGDYAEYKYGNGMKAAFDRIIALKPETSDNEGRVQRVLKFAASHLAHVDRPTLLDVGSGLGVFPFRMKKAGWKCTALEPDPDVVTHLIEVAGVDAVAGDFRHIDVNSLGQFDVITLNKVLEHVEDPVGMLREASKFLKPNGFLYAEVPDAIAAEESYFREEFFIEHFHVFSFSSVATMTEIAGFVPLVVERLREPSLKYTLRVFMRL